MAVTSITEDWKARDSEESLQDGITGTRLFNVYSDVEMEPEGNIYSAMNAYVALGDLFPGTLTAQCVSRRAQRNSDSRLPWTVNCSFKSVLNQLEQSRIDFPNPLDRTAKITWGARTVNMAVTRLQQARGALYYTYHDWDPAALPFDGKTYSFANSASDPFDPPAEVPTTQWMATVTKNVTLVPEWFMTYENGVNDADFTLDGRTITKGCGKLGEIRLSEKMKENGTVYRQLAFNIIIATPRPLRGAETIAPEPWDIEVLNEGMRTLGSVKWKNILDEALNSVNKPVPLSFNGQPISPSGAPIPEDDLYWMLYRPFNRKDFSVLPLT